MKFSHRTESARDWNSKGMIQLLPSPHGEGEKHSPFIAIRTKASHYVLKSAHRRFPLFVS